MKIRRKSFIESLREVKTEMTKDKLNILKKNQKKLKSFRNKMGSNIVWFDSLPTKKQYDLLFEWEREKYDKRNIKRPVKKKLRGRNMKTLVVTTYPASLKHFIRSAKEQMKYKTTASNVREAAIDILLKNK